MCVEGWRVKLAVELCMCEVVRERVDILTGLSLGNSVFAFFENRLKKHVPEPIVTCIAAVVIANGTQCVAVF